MTRILFDTILDTALSGVPALFRRNLPKPVQRLRLVAWIVVIVVVASFFLTAVPSLEVYRQLLKTAVLGGLVILIVVLIAMTLVLKSQKKP